MSSAGGCRKEPVQLKAQLPDAKAALANGDYQRAEELASAVPLDSPDRLSALAIAGEAAAKAGRTEDAVRHYQALSKLQQQSREPPLGLFYAAEAYRDAGRLADAETLYGQFLTFVPDNALTHERLAFLLNVSGRRWESLPHYFVILRSGTATVPELALLADLDRPIEQRGFLEDCANKSPEDEVVKLGLAAHAFWEGKLVEAESRLRAAVTIDSNAIAAQAMLGELLVDRSPRDFVMWHQNLPKEVEEHPDIWYVRGLRARRQNQLRVAARCFWEAVKRAPTSRRATVQLGQVLTFLNEDAGGEFAARGSQMTQLTQALDDLLQTPAKAEASLLQITTLMEQMGREWEACAWGLVARQQFPDSTWPSEVFARLTTKLGKDLPLVTDSANLALRHDRSESAEFSSILDRLPESHLADTGRQRHSNIRFVESAESPDFVYLNGDDPSTPGARTYEQTGGGVAVLDFDGDRWPDLYFTQGGEANSPTNVPLPSSLVMDRLFRNVQGRSFVDVTAQAGLVERGFGQGCTVGDIDNDGFPDLYVANIGRNQLYRNNGDGTFSDITAKCGLVGDDWTTSCVLVDLNADGLPDIYDVNYLSGPKLFEIICQGHTCSPKAFAGASDRLFLNRGDGTFEFAPSVLSDSNGKGLGIVALDLHVRGRPSLFVANDQVPSFLLRNHATNDRFRVRLEDEAVVAGVAFNQDGLAMASMGIACDDANGDGRMDFFVTTFKDESRMLFLQDAAGLFIDATNGAGLRAFGLSYVGWGAQFVDADLDGEPDLITVNGHVDDYRGEGGDFHMPPQFFHNLGGGRFTELPNDAAGPYFSQKYLGRGLARLDWNGDGRMDAVASNMGARASLVTNLSTSVGQYLSVRLHARTTARDAIGSVVDVVAGQRRWSKQLVAGDGYMASNERMLQFGLSDSAVVKELRVRWPSGAVTTIYNLPTNATVELVEGSHRGIVWRGSDQDSFTVDAAVTAQ
ncbi:MAG: FG-GAP-like repeat-containing protein [Planctomycetota bacterium]